MSFFWSFGSNTKKNEPTTPPTHSLPEQQQYAHKAMSNTFRKGVQYNMKIVLRGDVMTGKTALFKRLQGEEFDASYVSTPQIQVANIPWHYRDSSDIIKIEVWDVVDKAHNNKNTSTESGIKLEHNAQPKQEQQQQPPPPPSKQQTQQQQSTESPQLGLDASTVNVYRNTHAVIFLFDVSKQWTFDYVNNQLADVPETLSVLVIGNCNDKSAERVVNLDQIHATLYQHNKERIEKSAIKPNLIRYAETSMKTGFGLKYIYDYLAVPFLQLQMETLRKQLELKAVEIVDILEALDDDEKVPEAMRRRRGQDNFDQPSEPHLARQREEMQNMWEEDVSGIAADNPSPLEIPESPSFIRKETPPPPVAPVQGRRREGSLVSESEHMPAAVDQFDAGELNDDWFAADDTPLPIKHKMSTHKADSDNEDGIGNPMVAGDEDVESVEYYTAAKEPVVTTAKPKQPSAPESEDEQESDHDQYNSPYGDSFTATEPPSLFKNEFGNVWGIQHDDPSMMVRQTRIESDSEDEDNMATPGLAHELNRADIGTPSSFTGSGFGAYEEIGGDGENPWSLDDDKGHQEDHGSPWQNEPLENKDEQETQVMSEKRKGKKKVSSSSGKKKSKHGKKKSITP
ncbi:P-loop containing nucleoside triphosphate hydrolase protein [Lichtheimia hyalospora FSU 10163]|nr:P-loop containing nucleoside triphosphate hydrolase protein [Lichtheimia hyalospora FSU 10163]